MQSDHSLNDNSIETAHLGHGLAAMNDATKKRQLSANWSVVKDAVSKDLEGDFKTYRFCPKPLPHKIENAEGKVLK
jgi:hypothetical protein